MQEMAPVRKRRNAASAVRKRAGEQDEEGGTNRIMQRKHKLSDMLGSQWSKKELENFYKAYRKYGKDWQKVASAVHGRTAEMVAALYKMNRAYLSLPDQIGSAAGFIAMMIDHYHMLDISNSDWDSSEDNESSKNPKQQTRLKNKHKNANKFDGYYSGLIHRRSVSEFGYSPPGKKRTGGRHSRVAGKRSPRFHFSQIAEKKSETDTFCKEEFDVCAHGDLNDIEIAKTAALTVTEASLQATFPQVLETLTRTTQHIKYSSVQNADLKGLSAISQSSGLGCKDSVSANIDSTLEGGEGSTEIVKMVLTKSRRPLQGIFARKRMYSMKGRIKKSHKRLVRLEGLDNAPPGDSGKEHTQTGEVISAKVEKDKSIDMEVVDKKGKNPLYEEPRKRSRKLFSGDSQLQFHEEKSEGSFLEENAEASAQEVIYTDIQIAKPEISLENDKVSHSRTVLASLKLAATETDCPETIGSWLNEPHKASISEFKKSKRKMGPEKVLLQDEKQARKKLKKNTNTNESPRNTKKINHVEACASNGCTSESVNQNTFVCEATLSNQYFRRQNATMEEASPIKIDRVSESGWNFSGNLHSEPPTIKATFCSDTMTDILPITKANLIHCLSSAKVRRWCLYEWFYSAIDLPWFEKNEFVEYLNHAGLGRVPILTRVEWGVIRSSLGKPRRLSARFLQEEREKLDQYRESVRKIHNDVQAGVYDVLPADLALPFYGGQQVIALHPKQGGIHGGIVSSVDQNKCRVQFHKAELGVEFVLDIDCMPMNPVENMPAILRKRVRMWDGLCWYGDEKLAMNSSIGWTENVDARSSLDKMLNVPSIAAALPVQSNFSDALSNNAKADMSGFVKQTKISENEHLRDAKQSVSNWHSKVAKVQDREADNKALACLNCALDKKEALLMELKNMNDDISRSGKRRETLRNTEAFHKQYAYVLVQLKIANDQVISALKSLRERNAYQKVMVPPWHDANSCSRAVERSGTLERVGSLSLGTSPKITEIVTNAKRKARVMVDAAMQVISSLREEGNAVIKLGLELDSVSSFHPGLPSGKMKIKFHSYPDSIKDTEQENLNSHESFGPKLTAVNASYGTSKLSDKKEGFQLSEIAASCVSTLILIQTCSDRQFMPSEVTHLLDDAVRSLRPCSTSNMIVYKEIQQYMSIVKNQILTLMPTQPSISVVTDGSVGR